MNLTRNSLTGNACSEANADIAAAGISLSTTGWLIR